MHGIIFDIDGTLTPSNEFDSDLYVRAIRDCLGPVTIREEWSAYRHVTDSGILDELFEDNGIDQGADLKARVRERFVRLVDEYLEDEPCPPIAGAGELVARLREDPGIEIGIATGGWETSAQAKLQSAGFEVEGIPLMSADDHYDRTVIMSLCRDALGSSVERITYVGDGSWDLDATQQLGWDFIATGPDLRGKVDRWTSDFRAENWEKVWRC